jgi:hypothetical protein
MKKQWTLIAGRGSLGDMNWGVDFKNGRPLEQLQKELAELEKHYGETVLLTGGGGYTASLATLHSAEILPNGIGNHPSLQANLTVTKGDMCDYNQKTWKKTKPHNMTPYMDSWQISVKIEAS